MLTIMYSCPPRQGPPPSPTGCECQDAVTLMLHKLESKFNWETGWDWRHEDHYADGEMTNYRRIKHPVMKDNVFIFIEYGKNSSCMIFADGGVFHTSDVNEFDEAIAAFDEAGRFKMLAQRQIDERKAVMGADSA